MTANQLSALSEFCFWIMGNMQLESSKLKLTEMTFNLLKRTEYVDKKIISFVLEYDTNPVCDKWPVVKQFQTVLHDNQKIAGINRVQHTVLTKAWRGNLSQKFYMKSHMQSTQNENSKMLYETYIIIFPILTMGIWAWSQRGRTHYPREHIMFSCSLRSGPISHYQIGKIKFKSLFKVGKASHILFISS